MKKMSKGGSRCSIIPPESDSSLCVLVNSIQGSKPHYDMYFLVTLTPYAAGG